MANETLGGLFRLFNSGRSGTFTATGGTTVTVNNSYLTPNSVIIFTLKTAAGTPGAAPYLITTPVTGNNGSFQVRAASGDTSLYNYTIMR